MKKKFLTLIVTVTMSASLLVGCGDTVEVTDTQIDTTSDTSNVENIGEIVDETKELDDNSAAISESNNITDLSEVYNAYRDYANTTECETSYYLADIDNDSVPECLAWEYAGNGSLNHAKVLLYKDNALIEVHELCGGGTDPNTFGVSDGTICWFPDIKYILFYTNRQTWWGDICKRNVCTDFIYIINDHSCEMYHYIIREKDNLDTDWDYGVDGISSTDSKDLASSIWGELYGNNFLSKEPTRYITIEDAIFDYDSRIAAYNNATEVASGWKSLMIDTVNSLVSRGYGANWGYWLGDITGDGIPELFLDGNYDMDRLQ